MPPIVFTDITVLKVSLGMPAHPNHNHLNLYNQVKTSINMKLHAQNQLYLP